MNGELDRLLRSGTGSQAALLVELRRLSAQLHKLTPGANGWSQSGVSGRPLYARKYRVALSVGTWVQFVPANVSRVGLIVGVTPPGTAYISQAPHVAPVANEGFGITPESAYIAMLTPGWEPIAALAWDMLGAAGSFATGYEIIRNQ